MPVSPNTRRSPQTPKQPTSSGNEPAYHLLHAYRCLVLVCLNECLRHAWATTAAYYLNRWHLLLRNVSLRPRFNFPSVSGGNINQFMFLSSWFPPSVRCYSSNSWSFFIICRPYYEQTVPQEYPPCNKSKMRCCDCYGPSPPVVVVLKWLLLILLSRLGCISYIKYQVSPFRIKLSLNALTKYVSSAGVNCTPYRLVLKSVRIQLPGHIVIGT